MKYRLTLTFGISALLSAAACSDGKSGDDGTAGAGGTAGTSGGTGGSTGGAGGAGGSTAGAGGSTGGAGGSTAGAGGSTGGSAGAGGSAGSGSGTISLTGVVRRLAPATGAVGGPLEEGVDVCVLDSSGMPTSSCGTTDAMGEFMIADLTPDTDIAIRADKMGLGSFVYAVDLGMMDLTLPQPLSILASGVTPGAFGSDPTVTQDMSKGSMFVFATEVSGAMDAGTASPGFDWVVGASFAIDPAGGDGPMYSDAMLAFVSGATETQGGPGAFIVNLDEGQYTVTVSHATKTCNPIPNAAFGWPDGMGGVSFPIFAGQFTQALGFFCPAPVDGGDGGGMDASTD